MPVPKGQRYGGIKKGQKHAKTLEKAAARELVRALITSRLEPLITAQLAHAEGLKYLVTRDKKTGKFIRVTEAMAKVNDPTKPDEEIIEVWEKDPSVQAFTDLLNRALDKPKEQPQELQISGSLELVSARLLAARKRLALKP